MNITESAQLINSTLEAGVALGKLDGFDAALEIVDTLRQQIFDTLSDTDTADVDTHMQLHGAYMTLLVELPKAIGEARQKQLLLIANGESN